MLSLPWVQEMGEEVKVLRRAVERGPEWGSCHLITIYDNSFGERRLNKFQLQETQEELKVLRRAAAEAREETARERAVNAAQAAVFATP